MMNHIDVSSVLRRAVCDLYSNLVTRPTGQAVRAAIETQLAEMEQPTLTVIDFSNVRLLDFSCADEVVAKLLLRYVTEESGREVYFMLRGVREPHLDAIESALESYGLALVAQIDGGEPHLVGGVSGEERRAWEAAASRGRVTPGELACALGTEPTTAERMLGGLHARRLVMRFEDTYVAVGVAP